MALSKEERRAAVGATGRSIGGMGDRSIRRGASDTCLDTCVVGERRPCSPRVSKKRGPDGRMYARIHALSHAHTSTHARAVRDLGNERKERERERERERGREGEREMGNLARDETRMTGGSARESVMIHRKGGIELATSSMEKDSGHSLARASGISRAELRTRQCQCRIDQIGELL